jgi:hypothetical protein
MKTLVAVAVVLMLSGCAERRCEGTVHRRAVVNLRWSGYFAESPTGESIPCDYNLGFWGNLTQPALDIGDTVYYSLTTWYEYSSQMRAWVGESHVDIDSVHPGSDIFIVNNRGKVIRQLPRVVR